MNVDMFYARLLLFALATAHLHAKEGQKPGTSKKGSEFDSNAGALCNGVQQQISTTVSWLKKNYTAKPKTKSGALVREFEQISRQLSEKERPILDVLGDAVSCAALCYISPIAAKNKEALSRSASKALQDAIDSNGRKKYTKAILVGRIAEILKGIITMERLDAEHGKEENPHRAPRVTLQKKEVQMMLRLLQMYDYILKLLQTQKNDMSMFEVTLYFFKAKDAVHAAERRIAQRIASKGNAQKSRPRMQTRSFTGASPSPQN
ncbi:uncharacterized protein NEMAJ01_0471 [Nematocida major]|uniref:uncharacterized protein n=1 Tax=Nematocida major TaxID=1912982 RepID=UPI0020079E19|nr:uncharacterized protein NEMAJ01_0471 [Nematocida major]KAH9385575.1 hypothetical protein NEMAJ01_0471 [Nematocida major]